MARVAIIGGTGSLGRGLATRLAAEGVTVTIGSRVRERAVAVQEELLREDATIQVHADDNTGAAAAAPIVILAVPFTAQVGTIRDIADSLRSGSVLVEATVPLATAVGGRPTQPLRFASGSAAENARDLLPAHVDVVAALHTVSGDALANTAHELNEDVLLSGDRREAKERVAAVVESIDGLRTVDCGPLERSRILEQLTPLIIGLNIRHKIRAGIRITGYPKEAT